jgi:hypothetical protein
MKNKNILKGAVVLLIVITLFLSTIVTAETIKGIIENQIDISNIKTTNAYQFDLNIEPVFGPVIFSQPPSEEDDPFEFYISASNMENICADDFWKLKEEICDIHWWGLSLFWDGAGWEECDPTGTAFQIIFYELEAQPETISCTYIVEPTPIPTGKFYNGFEMYYWETNLDPCCNLTNGWVSIQSIKSPGGCSFLWANSQTGNMNALQDDGTGWEKLDDNLAFELTCKECNPGIDVEKYVWDPINQEWIDADTESSALDLPICEDTEFKIVILNNGDYPLINIIVWDKMHDSLKYISGDPEPDKKFFEKPFWYIEWDFPGPLNPKETIEVYITAHVEGPECSYDFNYVFVKGYGCVNVYDEDFAYVHAYKKSKNLNMSFLQVLQSYPKLFPIIRKLLGL